MYETIAAFRSRTQAVDCHFKLMAAGVHSRLCGTRAGCGLAVKIPAGEGLRAKFIIARQGYELFCGYSKVRLG